MIKIIFIIILIFTLLNFYIAPKIYEIYKIKELELRNTLDFNKMAFSNFLNLDKTTILDFDKKDNQYEEIFIKYDDGKENIVYAKKGDILSINNQYNFRLSDGFKISIDENEQIEKLRLKNKTNLLKEKLSSGTNTDMKNWSFIHLDEDKINELFLSLNTNLKLDQNLSSPYAYIIDKFSSLRGRDDSDGIKFGYDSRSVADINNNMLDDVKIILAEYRLALKKNNIFKD